MTMIEGAGVPLHVEEHGPTGAAATVLVHDLAADALTFGPLAGALGADGRRAITYDRRGYGASGAPTPYSATTVEEQAEDLAAVIAALNAAPALLVGQGFGALIALDVVRRHPALVCGAVAYDPPLFAFVPEATEGMAAQRQMLEDALREGGPRAAVAAWLGADAPADELARAQDAHRGFFADYAGLASWPVTRPELRAMVAPVTLLTSPDSAAVVVLAADRMAALMPDARRVTDGDIAAAALAVG